MKLKLSLLVMFLLTICSVKAQDQDAMKPTFVGKAISMQRVPSIASQTNLPPARVKEAEMKDARASKNDIIPGKDPQKENDYFVRNQNRLAGKISGKAPTLVFDAASSNSQPTDPALAVGPDHVFVVFNTGFIIYDKAGNALTPQTAPNPTIFPNGGCCDLTVSYDNAADRWVITFLGAGAQIAVSDGPDPINDGWNVYTIPSVSDYQKLSVWSDGYYITDNTTSSNSRIYALERDAMLAGDPNAQIIGFPLPGIATNGFYSPQAINVTDDNLPAAGSAPIVYLQDDAWGGVSEDHIKVWTVDVDWDTPGNSTISQPNELTTTPFISVFDNGSFSNLTQPGGGGAIDALQATIMNQAQFRKFSGHNSAVFDFVVDTDASGGELAGIRWFELRQSSDGQPWTIHQEGTYTSPDGKHAWHGSMMMDIQGNIGMGYTAMAGADTPNPTDFRVSSYYTGRFASDPLNTMTISEELIAAGNGNIPSNRYGDYSKIDIDPNNDKEFWFINEYINSGRKDVVGVFQIAPNFNDDVGVVSIDAPETGMLTATEAVTVTIFNFGQNDASNFDVTFQVDGGAVVTETFAGPIASATSEQYTFTATADLSTEGQTYSITAATDYGADEDNTNDAATKEVTHLDASDVGVTAITEPVSGSGLSATETVTVTIENFGSTTQTSIPVFYTLDGASPVSETYTGSIAQGETDSYSFTQTADLSELGTYEIVAGTELTGDADETNDDTTVSVTNFICQPESDCAGFNDGVTQIELADQNISTNCGTTGYSDDTDIVFNFVLGDNPFEGTLQMGFSDSEFALWIDFNDNNAFEADELIANDLVANANTDFNFTINFSDFPNATNGEHLMRLRGEDESGAGDVTDPCDDLQFGRTNDYTANVSGSLGVGNESFSNAEFVITSLPNNHFELLFNTSSYTDKLPVNVYNVLGQNIAYYVLENNGNGYNKTINMSYVSSGVYFVKIGDENLNKVKRVIVK